MSSTKISIIIPTYQHGRTIASCLTSVLEQTRKPDEVIVVDDGSKDQTIQTIKPFLDQITYVRQSNQGPQAARNRGWLLSRGDLLLFCDADAILDPFMLEKMERVLRDHPEVSYVYSAFRYGWKRFASFSFDAERLRQFNFVHTTSLVRREHFPGFDPQIPRFQDWDVWLTMLRSGRVGFHLEEELFRIRVPLGRTGISKWRPRMAYRHPWRWLPIFLPSVKAYERARARIQQKHGL